LAESGSAVSGLMHFTPFFEFAIVVVVVGSFDRTRRCCVEY
jgi:hypothetical protein